MLHIKVIMVVPNPCTFSNGIQGKGITISKHVLLGS